MSFKGFIKKLFKLESEMDKSRMDDVICGMLESSERIVIHKDLSGYIFDVNDISTNRMPKWRFKDLDHLCMILMGRMGKKLGQALKDSNILEGGK